MGLFLPKGSRERQAVTVGQGGGRRGRIGLCEHSSSLAEHQTAFRQPSLSPSAILARHHRLGKAGAAAGLKYAAQEERRRQRVGGKADEP